jgi:hypothetical protein
MTKRPQAPATQTGIVVATAIVAGIDGGPFGERQQHAEGIVVSTAITAGIGGDIPGERNQHAEGIVVSSAITAGADGLATNHAEGLV